MIVSHTNLLAGLHDANRKPWCCVFQIQLWMGDVLYLRRIHNQTLPAEVRGLGKIHMFCARRSPSKAGHIAVMGFYRLCSVLLAFTAALCCYERVSIQGLTSKLTKHFYKAIQREITSEIKILRHYLSVSADVRHGALILS